MSAEVTLCIFSCVTFPIFPPINIPTTTLNIFTANAAGVTYLGPVCPASLSSFVSRFGTGGVEAFPVGGIFLRSQTSALCVLARNSTVSSNTSPDANILTGVILFFLDWLVT